MSNARIADGFDARAPNAELRLLWDQGTGKGAELPSAYFDSVRASDMFMGRALVVSVEHVAPREILIELAPSVFSAHRDGDTELKVTLEFPDRRAALDCDHGGMADAYFVDIALTMHDGALVSSSVRQSVHLGDF